VTARESVDAKALRYLTEGRLVVTYLVGDAVTAVCMGDTGSYDLGHDPRRPGAWWCTCRAAVNAHRCAHVLALQSVTIRRKSQP
jgi:hypothetical protein